MQKNKNYTVAVVCDSIDFTLGGSSISAKRFTKFLSNKHLNVFLYTNNVQNKKSKFFNKLVLREVSNFPFFKTPNFIFGFARKKYFVEEFSKNKIDLLYCVYPSTFISFFAIKVAIINKIPIVGHFHVQGENINKYLKYKPLNFLFYKFSSYFYNKCVLVICPSEFAKNLLKQYGVKSKIIVISNGVDLKKFKQIKNFKKTNEYFNFLYFGRLEPEKDLYTLLSAIKIFISKHKKVIFTIAGNGILKESINNYVVANKLTKNIVIKGYVENSEVVNLYNNANCFVSPSLVELEGMTVLEAMSCGLPIIVSDSPNSASKYFIKNNGLIFKHKNAADLCKKLEFIYLNYNKYKNDYIHNSLLIAKRYGFNKSRIIFLNNINSLLIKSSNYIL